MTETPDEMNENVDGFTVAAQNFTPPNVSWATVKNLADRMSKEGGIPSQIDRSYLSNLPGSTQAALLHGLKAINFVDEDRKPTADFETFVESDEQGRKELVKAMLAINYPGPMKLGPFATQQQLEDEFRKFGVTGSTLRKAVSFFLAAAKFADLALSPHFKSPRAEAAERRPRKPRGNGGKLNGNQDPLPPLNDPPRTKVHPLIEGLFAELPPISTEFTPDQQKEWLELAAVALRVIYKKTGAPSAERRTDSTDGGGDDE